MRKPKSKKIWIDLDNSPHVPFFKPIIHELEARGFTVVITVRDFAQTAALADLHNLNYVKIGHHYGKHIINKVVGTILRSTQLLPYIYREKPALAIAHGARSLFIVARLLGIPALCMTDYEHSKGNLLGINWFMVPDVISKSSIRTHGIPLNRILTYPGIKEDVYVPFFKPDPSVLRELDVPKGNFVALIRPPAVEAHYHNPEGEVLYSAVIDFLAARKDVSMILLSRYPKQVEELKSRYATLIEERLIVIPKAVYDGLNLIWFSDFVISGGGTMNREAAALGVPVYSIFRGPLGAVDRYLAENGRLVLLESVRDVVSKIIVNRRKRPFIAEDTKNQTLESIVESIISVWRVTYNN